MRATGLAAASGRWARRGPAIIVDLDGSGFGGFRKRAANTTEGELGFETAGSVPDKDYLRWVQGSLNLFFEKRGRSERVKANGEDSAEYRKAVKLFKSLAKVTPVDDTVDEKTQNAIIKANESNQKYLAWLRSALDKAGYPHLTIAYEKHEKPVAVIREFQRDYSGLFGFTLQDDGFVGAKTHLALLHAVRPPKPEPPKPKPEVDWITLVERMPLATLKAEAKESERLECLRKFLLRALRGTPVDDRYKKVSDVGVHHFVQDFKRRCAGKRDAELARCFRGLHKDVLAPINYIMGELLRWRGDTTDGCICSEMEECEAGRYFLAKARQASPESLYTCFRNVIEPGFQICRKPCPRC